MFAYALECITYYVPYIDKHQVTKIPTIGYIYIIIYIHLMCKGAHVWHWEENIGTSPILNDFGSGESRMYPT